MLHFSMEHMVILLLLVAKTIAFLELPKFSQLQLLYPGYYHDGGEYRDREIRQLVGGNFVNISILVHNTAALRLSWTLNRFGGQHSIGVEPIYLSGRGVVDSEVGRDGQQYIYHSIAYGPYLASRYGNPTVVVPTIDTRGHRSLNMSQLYGRQGIIRLVSYHQGHRDGHVALWDCQQFYQSKDWISETGLVSVEIWESPDSYCPPPTSSPPVPHIETAGQHHVNVIPRARTKYHSDGRTRRHGRNKNPDFQFWVQ